LGFLSKGFPFLGESTPPHATSQEYSSLFGMSLVGVGAILCLLSVFLSLKNREMD
jgi:hypothetical protein